MSRKSAMSLMLGSALALGAATAQAEDQFASLANVDATAMTSEQMAAIEGKAHTSFPLGALLVDNTDGRVAGTPAWTEGHGLHPSRALSKAQVSYGD